MKIMFILYVLAIFIVSNGLGKTILKTNHRLYPLRSVIGFAMLLFFLQIGYFPIQFFQLSSDIVFMWSILIFFPLFLFGIKKLCKEDFFFLKTWEFYVLVVLVFVVIKVLPGNEAGDDWFYMPLIMDNADINSINSIDPRTGWNWQVASLWKYQGYYLFNTFIYQVHTLFFESVESIFITFRTTMSFVMIIFSSIMIYYVGTLFQNKNKVIVFLSKILSILLVNYLDWSHIYWGSFAVLPTMFPLMLLMLNEYSVNYDKKYVKMIMIVNGAMLSLFSSALFLNCFLIFSFFVYNVWKRKTCIKHYAFMLFPSLIYFCFFVNYPILCIPLIIIYYVIYKVNLQKIEMFLNKYLKFLLMILPVIFVFISALLKDIFCWDMYRLSYTFLIFNISVSFFIAYCIYKKKEMQPVIIAFLIFNIFFFNPFVSKFVSTLFTTDQVYYRLFYITKNPIILFFIFLFIYENFCIQKKFFERSLFVGLSLGCCYYSYILLKGVNYDVLYSQNYDYLLRESKDCLALGKFLNDKEELHGSYVWSIYFEPRQYNLSYKSKTIRYPENEHNDNEVIKTLYQINELNEEEYILVKNAIFRENVSLLITYKGKGIGDGLLNFADIIYENDLFVLYEIRK